MIVCPVCEVEVTTNGSYCSVCGEDLSSSLMDITQDSEASLEESIEEEPAAATVTPASMPTPDVYDKPTLKLDMSKVDLNKDPEERPKLEEPETEAETPQAAIPPIPKFDNIKPPPVEQPERKPTRKPDPLLDPTHQAELLDMHRIEEDDAQTILNKCQVLKNSGYNLYGLFGNAGSGKTSFLYALRKQFQGVSSGFGHFTTEGRAWTTMAEDLERQWQSGKSFGTDRAFYAYQAKNANKKDHIAMVDIAGENFQNVESWSGDVFDFFGTYLSQCSGFFIMLELDEYATGGAAAGSADEVKSRQMEKILSFLSVAASIDHINDLYYLEEKRKAVQEAARMDGKSQLQVPVALCLTKADVIHQYTFDRFGKIIPGNNEVMDDPWEVVTRFWPDKSEALLNLAPKLKVEWVSCLGRSFEKDKKAHQPLGLRSVFDHVVLNPPPAWALPSGMYRSLRRFLRV